MPMVEVRQSEIIGQSRRRFSYEEYVRLVDLGFFGDCERIELLDGELICRSPVSEPHTVSVLLSLREVQTAFGEGFVVRPGLPLGLLAIDSCPEPDLAVIAGSPRDFRSFPTMAILVVEVSLSTLAYDLGPKKSLYARGGVAEYWVVDVPGRKVTVHRGPRGDGYESVTTFDESGSIQALGARSAVSVLSLLS
jgi:Uma2 family endonuclease